MVKVLDHYAVVNRKPSITWVDSEFIEDRLSMDSFNDEYLKWKENCLLSSFFKMNKIKDIAKGINIGFTSKRNYQSEGIKFLNISNIEQFNFKLEDVKLISKEVHESLKKSQLECEDVLLTITGTIGDSVVVPSNFNEANISANIVAIRLKKTYDPYYLCAFFNSKWGKMQTKGSSKSNVWANLGVQQVKEIEVPIPSSEIQKHIGDKVRKAEKLREEAKRLKKEAEITLSNELNSNKTDRFNIKKEYIFINEKPNILYVSEELIDNTRIEAMFYKKEDLLIDSKLVEYKHGYRLLKDICMKITDGTHKTPNYREKGVTFISSKNILEDEIDFENVKYISEEEHKEISKRCNVECGDILFTKIGRIGYAKVVPNRLDAFSIFVSVALLKLKKEVDEYFLEVFLNSDYGKNQSKRLCKGANQPDFHLEDIGELKIPILPIEMQKEIGNKMRKVEELKCNIRNLIQQAKQDIEDLIEGNFDISKIKESN